MVVDCPSELVTITINCPSESNAPNPEFLSVFPLLVADKLTTPVELTDPLRVDDPPLCGVAVPVIAPEAETEIVTKPEESALEKVPE